MRLKTIEIGNASRLDFNENCKILRFYGVEKLGRALRGNNISKRAGKNLKRNKKMDDINAVHFIK